MGGCIRAEGEVHYLEQPADRVKDLLDAKSVLSAKGAVGARRHTNAERLAGAVCFMSVEINVGTSTTASGFISAVAPKVDLGGVVSNIFEDLAALEVCPLKSLDLSLALVSEVLVQSLELCPIPEDMEAPNLEGDGVLVGNALERASSFPSAWGRDFLLDGCSK